MSECVTIAGNGAMATVCAILLIEGGHRVTMWGASTESIERLKSDREQHKLLPGVKVPECVRLTADDKTAFTEATLMISAVPTQAMRSVWTRLRDRLPPGVPIVSTAKGIETDALLRPTEILADVLGPSRSYAVVSGPNIAAEIAKRMPATAVVASNNDALARRVQAAMSTQRFRLYTNNDVVGIELAGAMKNIIAVAAGMLDGLKAGNNAKSSLVTRGLVEISRLGVAMGAQPMTFAGLAGLGDLITTCVSPEGRNRRLGEQLGLGKSLQQALTEMSSVAEGVPTTRAVKVLAERYDVDMPIMREVHAILFEGKPVGDALNDLMTRDPKSE